MKFTTLLIVFTFLYNLHGDELDELREEVKSLNAMVYKMKATHNESRGHYLKLEIDRALQKKNNQLLSLSTNATNLTIKGDIHCSYHRNEFLTSGAGSQTESRDRIKQVFFGQIDDDREIAKSSDTLDKHQSFIIDVIYKF